MRSPVAPPARLVAALAARRVLRPAPATSGADDGGRPGRGGVLPAGRTSPSGWPATTPTVENLHRARRRAARPRAHHQGDRRGRRGRPGRLRARLPAGGRRRRRRDRRGRRARRGRRRRPASRCGARRRRPRARGRSTRTSGSTRSGWPTSATRSPTQLAEIDPDHADDYRGQRRRPARRPRARSTRSTPTGWPTASATRSSSATTRSATWPSTACTSSRSPASPPTPSRRRPTCRAAGPDPRRGHHHGLLRDAWQPASSPRPLADDLGVATAVLDPIEGLTDETADEDYLSLMRTQPRRPEEANGC